MMTNGSPFPANDPCPRKVIVGMAPGSIFALFTYKPVARPCNICAALLALLMVRFSVLMDCTLPVKSDFLTPAYPIATTSSNCMASGSKVILRVFPPVTFTLLVAYPIKEISRVAFMGTRTVNLPSISVTVPLSVPFTRTDALGNVSPKSSYTTPDTLRFCADNENIKLNITNSKTNFNLLFIVSSFLY